MLRFEMLRAKRGDAFLLHHGTDDKPQLMIVDGGWRGVWRQTLSKRLEEIKEARGGGQLRIDMMMCSHVDEDHIAGLLDLTDHLHEQHLNKEELDYKIARLWHNTFGEALGEAGEVFQRKAEVEAVSGASTEVVAERVGVSEGTAVLLASAPQGQYLRNNASVLGIKINPPFDGMVRRGVIDVVPLNDLQLTVLGPDDEQIEAFRTRWEKEFKPELDAVATAKYVDDNAYNLASIVVLVEVGGKSLLLTGDARGDFLLKQAETAGLLEGGTRPIDVFKVPHHGSRANAKPELFAAFPARHYVISGDGSHGIPNVDTFEMIFTARQGDDDKFTIWLTYDPADFRPHHGEPYPVAELDKLFDDHGRGSRFDVEFPGPGESGKTIELA